MTENWNFMKQPIISTFLGHSLSYLRMKMSCDLNHGPHSWIVEEIKIHPYIYIIQIRSWVQTMDQPYSFTASVLPLDLVHEKWLSKWAALSILMKVINCVFLALIPGLRQERLWAAFLVQADNARPWIGSASAVWPHNASHALLTMFLYPLDEFRDLP